MTISATPPLPYSDRTEWIATPDGHQLSLRVLTSDERQPRAAILCLHGLFSDGRFFLNGRQEGPGSVFLEQGYQVMVGELRGHGRSKWPSSSRPWDWSFDEYVQQDIPALINAAAALQEGSGPLFVLAHSLGGYALLAALGHDSTLQAKISGVCMLASAINDYSEMGIRKRLLFQGAAFLSNMVGFFPARLLRMGVSDEPANLMKQFLQWAPQGRFASLRDELDYWQCLSRVTLPVWAGVGAADKFHASARRGRRLVDRLASQDKTFIEIGVKSGFSRDFAHLDVLRGAAAKREVLPQLTAWMDARTQPQEKKHD
ncbi:MAG TPA: alpha/beta fold hydrolase [Noviherbaspirillum sp.]|nr:alpha/beta fold hydrolase [Noviherbaspirillum sp.]